MRYECVKIAAMTNHIRKYQNISPTLGRDVYIDPQACVIGNVNLGDDASVWPMAVVRGDVNTIEIGARSNVQDGAILHVTHDGPYSPGGYVLTIGEDVTIGHQAMLHGCTVGNRVLIGMSAMIMDGVVIKDEVLVAAGAVVPPRKVLESGYLYRGSPAKQIRPLTDEEKDNLKYGASHYVKMKNKYLEENY